MSGRTAGAGRKKKHDALVIYLFSPARVVCSHEEAEGTKLLLLSLPLVQDTPKPSTDLAEKEYAVCQSDPKCNAASKRKSLTIRVETLVLNRSIQLEVFIPVCGRTTFWAWAIRTITKMSLATLCKSCVELSFHCLSGAFFAQVTFSYTFSLSCLEVPKVRESTPWRWSARRQKIATRVPHAPVEFVVQRKIVSTAFSQTFLEWALWVFYRNQA